MIGHVRYKDIAKHKLKREFDISLDSSNLKRVRLLKDKALAAVQEHERMMTSVSVPHNASVNIFCGRCVTLYFC